MKKCVRTYKHACVFMCVCEHTNICKCVSVFAIWTFQPEQISSWEENKTGTSDLANIDKVEGEVTEGLDYVTPHPPPKK